MTKANGSRNPEEILKELAHGFVRVVIAQLAALSADQLAALGLHAAPFPVAPAAAAVNGGPPAEVKSDPAPTSSHGREPSALMLERLRLLHQAVGDRGEFRTAAWKNSGRCGFPTEGAYTQWLGSASQKGLIKRISRGWWKFTPSGLKEVKT